VRSRSSSQLVKLPLAKPWIIPHPVNRTAWFPDEAAVIIRQLRIDGGVSKERLDVVFALCFSLIFWEAPPPALLPSNTTMHVALTRLGIRDTALLTEEVLWSLNQYEYSIFCSAFDDTYFAQASRHVHFISFFCERLKTPVLKLLSLKSTCGKDAATNAKLDFDNIIEAHLPPSRHGGACSDHAALAEGAALGDLIIKHGEEAAAAAAAAAATGGLTYSAGSMVGGYYSSPTTLGCSSKSGRAPAPNTPGAPSTLRSLLQAFFVGSNGTIVTGANELRRGEPCPHCSVELEVNKKKVRVPSEHWGGVACFLDNKDRKVLGRLVFMATSDATELHRPKAQFVGRAMTERKGAGVV
jgi:hypothetical protein